MEFFDNLCHRGQLVGVFFTTEKQVFLLFCCYSVCLKVRYGMEVWAA